MYGCSDCEHDRQVDDKLDRELPRSSLHELRETLEADRRNQSDSEQIQAAISLLERDVPEFLATYFRVVEGDSKLRGVFSVTSR